MSKAAAAGRAERKRREMRWFSQRRRRKMDARSAGQRYAPQWLRVLVLKRDDYKCFYCKRPVTDENANIDHVKPWPLGLTVATNLVAACKDCNREKGRKKRPDRAVVPGKPWRGWRYSAPEENGPVVVRRISASDG